MIINHNMSALRSLSQIKNYTQKSSKSIEKLSSGLRINNAADDAAGLAISEKMRAQIRGLEQAHRNAQDGISLIQTAEGGLAQIIDPPLQRMRELAIQASNDTLSNDDRVAIQQEFEQMKASIDNIAGSTKFNGLSLLSTDSISVTSTINAYGGTRVELSTLVGNNPTETIKNILENFRLIKYGEVGNFEEKSIAQNWTLSQSSSNEITLTNNSGQGYLLGLNSPGGNIVDSGGWSNSFTFNANPDPLTDRLGAFEIADNSNPSSQRNDFVFSFFTKEKQTLNLQIGANDNNSLGLEINDVRTGSLGIDGLTILTSSDSTEAIEKIDKALTIANSERGRFGAFQNHLEHTINNIDTSSENLIAAESRIRDIDMAKEIMNETKSSILTQAALAMLAQSNQLPQGILQLLK